MLGRLFKEFSWSTGSFVILYHLTLLILLPIYLSLRTPSMGLLLTTLILLIICSLSITAGYHRYYAHKSYKLNKFLEPILLFFSTLAAQNSVLLWSHDHRNHHKYVDTKKDPYSITEGFWHAHFIWILKKRKSEVNLKIVRDLEKNVLVKFQHKYYTSLFVLTNLAVVLFFGYLFTDYLGAFVFLFLVRIFLSHHATWFINSLTHYWGAKPYSREQTAANNWFIALLTFGEGYHNYHHVFPSDYRNGIKWYHYDPTKYLIWGLHRIKLATHLRRTNKYIIRKRLVLEDKRVLLEKIKLIGHAKLQKLEQNIHTLSEKLHTNLSNIRILIEDYKVLKKEKVKTNKLLIVKQKIKELRKNFKRDYKTWKKITTAKLHKKLVATKTLS